MAVNRNQNLLGKTSKRTWNGVVFEDRHWAVLSALSSIFLRPTHWPNWQGGSGTTSESADKSPWHWTMGH
jgi:hypothetical protein